MFTSIKTTKKNKDTVSQLTRRLNLGAENIIARIAFSYSLAQDNKMDLSMVGDSQGKEYSVKVLFGDNVDFYIALICVHYGVYKTDKDIAKYVKMHVDNGLDLIEKEVAKKATLTGEEFIINLIDKGLKQIA